MVLSRYRFCHDRIALTKTLLYNTAHDDKTLLKLLLMWRVEQVLTSTLSAVKFMLACGFSVPKGIYGDSKNFIIINVEGILIWEFWI